MAEPQEGPAPERADDASIPGLRAPGLRAPGLRATGLRARGPHARVSLNEVLLGVLKAARGCALHEGLCEDLARAAAWLCRAGLDGLGPALEAMTAPGARDPARCRRVAGEWRFDPSPAAVAGPSAIDLALAAPGARVVLTRIDAPLVVLGHAGVAAGDHDCAFRLVGPAGELVIGGEGMIGGAELQQVLAGEWLRVEAAAATTNGAPAGRDDRVQGNPVRGDGVPGGGVHGGRVRGDPVHRDGVHGERDGEAHLDRAHVDGVRVDAAALSRIQDLAARTYVPASARSRALGAGAGLVDAD